jgi:RimJ/RimL family protein N-acetyltransferase
MAGFDANFCFQVPLALENLRLKLVPWNTAIHSTLFVNSIAPHPELFDWLPFGPFKTRDTFDPWYEGRIQSQTTEVAFAVFDKTRGDDAAGFAGMIGLLHSSPAHLSAEIGFLIILPAFQRTHVASNAVGLLLHYCLNPPKGTSGLEAESDSVAGLGLRRVYWSANPLNVRSIKLAERLGMRLEAVLKWDRVLPSDRIHFGRKEERRNGDPKKNQPGRDTACLAICWDDWVGGGREKAVRAMDRIS